MYEALVSVAYFDNLNKRTVIKLNLEPFYDENRPDRDLQHLIGA